MQVNWPFRLQQNLPSFKLVGQSLTPMRGLSGVSTIVPSMNAHWEAKMDVQVRGKEAQLQFEAFIACMEGYIGTTLVPVKHFHGPLDSDGLPLSQPRVGRISDSGTMEHWGLEAGSVNMAQLRSSVVARATIVEVDYINTAGIRPGHFFQIGKSLCKAQNVWEEADGVRVQFQPPLREAAAAGAKLTLDSPVLNMRLSNPDSIDINGMSRTTQYYSLAFEEAV